MTILQRLKGSMVATATPMLSNGEIDRASYQEFINWQVEQGTQGLVPVGTTGESPTLSHEEHHLVINLTIEVAKGRVPVVAGCGSNSTEEALDLTRHAKLAGADAAMLVTPYYNKPTQQGLYAHYAAVASKVDIPIIIYNIPGRSVVDMSVATMAKLYKDFPNIIGVKDASNKLERCLETRLELGDKFLQFSAEDPTAAAFLAQGGHGIISVVANFAPKLCRELQDSWVNQDRAKFIEVRDRLFPLSKMAFAFSSPTATVKTALHYMGKMGETVRLPLVEIEADEKAQVKKALLAAGLL